MESIKKLKDRSADAKTKYLYKEVRYKNNAMQPSTASQLVTRILLTSSGDGSKENVSIKEDKLGQLHSIVPHINIFMQIFSL